jgi:PPOX class probable F420-dependent enzyme
MEISLARSLITADRRCVLASCRPDGSLQLNPVVAIGGIGDVALIGTRAAAYKIANILRNPRVSLCVHPRTVGGTDWAQIDGQATVERPPAATAEIVAYYDRLNRPEFSPSVVQRLCEREELALIRIALEHAVPDSPQ